LVGYLSSSFLLFGAKKIPELAKGVGQGIKDFKKAIKEDEAKENVEQVEAKQPEATTTTTTAASSTDPKKSV